MLCDQGHITQLLVQQSLDRLVLIERKTEAILTQNYELLEFTIPRLFIVLPDKKSPWDFKNKFRTKFCLHFICECGEHTEAPGSNVRHRPHLARHEGYVVSKPTELFEKYGPLLLLMLEMLKAGTSVAANFVPALSTLRVMDGLDYVQSTIGTAATQLIKSIEYSLECVEESRPQQIKTLDGHDSKGSSSAALHDLAAYLADVEGLGGVDLRQLGSYLATKDEDNLYGNLYRMTTADGHVKWVCIDHYEAITQEYWIQKLREVVSVSGGKFDEQLGKITVILGSSLAADDFFNALRKVKGVLDLDVELSWEHQYTDLLKLKRAVSRSEIKSVSVRLRRHGHPKADHHLHEGQLYDPILDIMFLSSIQYFELRDAPKDFFEKCSPLTKHADLSHLKRLSIGARWTEGRADNHFATDIALFKSLVSKAPNLASLYLRTSVERLPAVFNAIPRHRTYQIEFNCKDFFLQFLPPLPKPRFRKNSSRDLMHLMDLFEIHGALLRRLEFSKTKLDEAVISTMVEATKNGSSLEELVVDTRDSSDGHIKNLAKVIAHSKLSKLTIALKKEQHLCILESVQWDSSGMLEVIVPLEMKKQLEDMSIIQQRVQMGLVFTVKRFLIRHPGVGPTEMMQKIWDRPKSLVSTTQWNEIGLSIGPQRQIRLGLNTQEHTAAV
ncbi:hypothetical protein EMPS_04233 [Entomortierella parvispora]|uniref:Uncharacterized protein n=1 Tax=Entomortierella parvispora TaxID=205924 RepID=A0A9P3LV70_9FUNG|nr:hypothetical protein EMPS_04233 [Entomortierella parvispora]